MFGDVKIGTMAQVQASISSSADARVPYGVLIARLGQESVARFRRALRPLDLSPQQYIVLKQLEAMGPASQTEVGDGLGIDYSNLAGVTAELYERGLIERTRDEADRRRYTMDLTGDGRGLLGEADAAIGSGEEDLLSALDETEQAQLWQLLRTVADSLDLCPGAGAEECSKAL